jgi:hypothetical protein
MVRVSCLSTAGIFFVGWIAGCLFVLTFLMNEMTNHDDYNNKVHSMTPRLRGRESEGTIV